VVFNLTYDAGVGSWKAGEFGPLKADAPYYQAVFRARLANRLQDLGYELRRVRDDFEIVAALAKGDVAAGFSKLDALGWIKEAGHEQIAEDYLAAVRDGKSVLVVSPAHAEGEKVTVAIREKRKQDGRLEGKEHRFGTLENANLTQAEKADPETLCSLTGAEAQFHRHGVARAGERVTITAENAEALAKQADQFVIYKPRELELANGDTVRITANGKDITGKHRLNNGGVSGDRLHPSGQHQAG
jgi:hypothetical protein